jgi:hypothetical protein
VSQEERRGMGARERDRESERAGGLRGLLMVSGDPKESNPSTASCVLVMRQFPKPGVRSLGPRGWLDGSKEFEIQESS